MTPSTIFDRVSGLAFILIGVGAVWHGYGLKVAFAADPVGPKAFPLIIGSVLALCGASIALRPQAIVWESGDYVRVITVALCSLVYPFLLPPLGFVPATALLGFVVAKAFKGRTLASAVAGVTIAGVIFCLIDLALGLGLPRGPLGV